MFNVGIIGAGRIARKMADTINALEGFNTYAIASRDLKKAQDFQKDFNFDIAYGSYEELLQDSNVDLVYIATPHSCHYEQMELCLKYKKPVLCEKIFTTSSKQSEDIYRRFEEKGLFISEALWTSFMPSRKIINDLLKENLIGKIVKMDAYFEVPLMHVERVKLRELGGGVAMDIGVYPFSFVLRTLGFDYDDCQITKLKEVNGVDASETVVFTYGDIKATCHVNGEKIRSLKVKIVGEQGYINIDGVNCPNKIKVYNNSRKLIKKIDCKPQYGGFEFELIEAKECILNNKLESPFWTHQNSIDLARIVDKIVYK